MLKKLLSNAMLSIVMDKQAKEKLQAIREVRKGTQTKKSTPSTDPNSSETETQIDDTPPDAPSRQDLIAEAMAIHQSKSKILDDLTLNEKQKLQELAAKALLGRGPKDGAD